ncbi:CRISPR-associated endoribonuclease Cas6 [Peptostreptococcus sp. D1]|uniref:CRISPR-associated endoribonuclease Cas6 n=1 Tax=Peptostreptococcus sp. D1 TaxID=72304 RepID=UPI0008F05ADF|nr:CRISPR-associated endoribonuclease Cas6 [Peptostreptococcus sp. D1]SFE94265.1 CRISPR-associated endoribonuclease Cas6 [Peptostreptococcus sp. D1]
MLTRLEMEIESPKHLYLGISSLLHGFILNNVPTEFARFIHNPGLNPFSQHLEHRDNRWFWVVSTMSEEAYSEIIEKLLLRLDEITLHKNNVKIIIINKNIEITPKKQFIKSMYDECSDRILEIKFTTPTTFKKSGKYIFYPDIKCIYQSLINKYNSSNNEDQTDYEDLLEDIVNNTEIIGYNLRNKFFYLEGIRINGFSGTIKIKISGTQTLVNYANMLFRFGCYSGIGAKTSLGMGATTIKRGDKI